MVTYIIPYEAGFTSGEYITKSLKDAITKSKETGSYGEIYINFKFKIAEYSELLPEYSNIEKDLK